MNLDTRWLEDFITLAEIRHFSKAAEARHITQPAFGRRIKALETESVIPWLTEALRR